MYRPQALRRAVTTAIGTAILALASAPASANLILHYGLQGVTMSAGATLLGTFDYDATTGQLVGFDLTAPLNAYGAATNFSPSNADYIGQSLYGGPHASFLIITKGRGGYLNLDFMSTLDGGGAVALLLRPPGMINKPGSYFSHNNGTSDNVTGGFAVADAVNPVPEPVSAGLFAIGLLALSSLRGRGRV